MKAYTYYLIAIIMLVAGCKGKTVASSEEQDAQQDSINAFDESGDYSAVGT